MIYQVEYAGHTVPYELRWPETRYFFRDYMQEAPGETSGFRVSDELLDYVRPFMPENSPACSVEYRSLILLTSHPLLRYGCCLFHAAAFLWRGRAWLVTGPSGVGKTTQFCNWQRLFPGETAMICGDMPVLEGRDDGDLWVHPSPWNGKEHLGSRFLSAPLGGIVRLEQKEENFIYPLPVCDAIPVLFRQFMVKPDTGPEILSLAGLVDRILHSAPVWLFQNRGDDESTVLLRETLMRGGRYDAL